MPVWNALLAGGFVAYCLRVNLRMQRRIQQQPQTSADIPLRFRKMLNRIAHKMNLNEESIKVITHKKRYYSSVGTNNFISKGGLVNIPKCVVDKEFAKSQWKEFQRNCGHELAIDLISKDASELKEMFGINLPKNVTKFNLAHELAHIKNNDTLSRQCFNVVWGTATLWPVTNIVLTCVSDFKLFSFLNIDFLPSLVDMYVTQGLAVTWLWAGSVFLNKKAFKYLCLRQEYIADRMAGELDLDSALGGVALLKAEMKFTKQSLFLRANENLRKNFDDKGNLLTSLSHPTSEKRIQALEKIIEDHNRTKAP